MNPIIEVENISKKYRIRREGQDLPYHTIREELVNVFKKPIDYLTGKKNTREDFWALTDVSFKVEPGEILGLIGPNGAGKSTLLKVLTRVTPPTEGRAIIGGKMGSLLDIGTGFHPELTGRENIYLNGAILGMRKKEIDKKFNEMIEFSGIGKFLDTPIKRYSGGMCVRLAFSIAAFLEPDILLIDEVLSVGDAAFQKKSLEKMEEITKGGKRTVIFVSHNMGAVQNLCGRAILLNKGKVVKIGPTNEVIHTYLHSQDISWAERSFDNARQAPGDDLMRLKSVKVKNALGKVSGDIDIKETVFIEIEYWNLKPGSQRVAGLHFWNEEGIHLFTSYDLHNTDWRKRNLGTGLVKSICKIPGNFLAEGRISVSLLISTHLPLPMGHINVRDIVSFNIFDPFSGDSVKGDYDTAWPGVVRPMLEWEDSFKEEEVKT